MLPEERVSLLFIPNPVLLTPEDILEKKNVTFPQSPAFPV